MEREPALMYTRILCGLVLYLLLVAGNVRAEHKVVLVTASDSPLETPDSLALRKIYLGLEVWQGGQSIKGLRNLADPQIDKVFLQNILAMTDQTYQRRLLSMRMNYGQPKQQEFESIDALTKALLANPYSVSYVWSETADANPKLKVLKVLWQGD
jgi:hypothetical protein